MQNSTLYLWEIFSVGNFTDTSEISCMESIKLLINTFLGRRCLWRFTPYNDDGRGGAVYLDRHTLHCPNGYLLNTFKLERNPPPRQNKIRYKYYCCRAQLPCTDNVVINPQTYNGGGNGNTVYFDRQTIDCHDKGMSFLKLDRYGNNWNYKYHCCKTNYASASVSCYNANTGFNRDGRGNSVYLDRHNVHCSSTDYFITKFKLDRNWWHTKYRYDYRCCKVNAPPAKN